MKAASDVVSEIVSKNPILNFGMIHKLLNLSHVEKFIHSAVEAKTRRKVTPSAILMALSRLQSKLDKVTPLDPVRLDRINIRSGLCYFVVPKTKESKLEINRLEAKVLRRDGFISTTQALSEIAVCIDDELLGLARETSSQKLRDVDRDLAALELTFKEPKCGDPGTIYQLLEQITMHNINLVNVSTASCELTIYMTEEDASLAYNALYQRFVKQAPKKDRPPRRSK